MCHRQPRPTPDTELDQRHEARRITGAVAAVSCRSYRSRRPASPPPPHTHNTTLGPARHPRYGMGTNVPTVERGYGYRYEHWKLVVGSTSCNSDDCRVPML